ncbi:MULTISPECIES: hypothetical protein [Pseudomonadota]|uniref:Uncharacterized protein n=2 Tax=root TaxID=1 RepID=A0A6F9EXT6_9CAUD|nr:MULTISPECIES: hypothetical protein [Pseudomonadota]CAB3623659.1 Putative conserved hypothetical protein [Bacteriophage APSE-7]CAB3635839.1 Putative conserved hypothetical protein [Hamiltonella phage APSE-8]CAB3775406.1 Putative conserved hypothetical protein [Bacteriophage APSE-3]CAB3775486.1 Putative conserved hypothetical protein [Bacteriophage APSE-2]ASV34121.1 hypothetical protein CJJ18_09315 [Candidatus Hamiltonella defensa]
MERKSVFAWSDNAAGYVQAVIVTRDFPEFEKRGFVSSIDEIKTPEKSQEPKKGKRANDDKTAD